MTRSSAQARSQFATSFLLDPSSGLPGGINIFFAPAETYRNGYGCTTDGCHHWVFGESGGWPPPPVLACGAYSNNPYDVDYKHKHLVLRSLRVWGFAGRVLVSIRNWDPQFDMIVVPADTSVCPTMELGRLGVDLGERPYVNADVIDAGALVGFEIAYDIE